MVHQVFDCARVSGSAAEEGVMTAPNPAATARPGWRGTDPDGGTWVLMVDEDGTFPWHFCGGDGIGEDWRSQEEAEAAGLVPLVAETDVKAAVDAYVTAVAVERAELTAALADARSAAPAPLDPGNPEHLRQVRDYLDEVNGGGADDVWSSLQDVQDWLTGEAERLEQEQREAEQDAADRKRAAELVEQAYAAADGTFVSKESIALAGIRAGRAERQEAEK